MLLFGDLSSRTFIFKNSTSNEQKSVFWFHLLYVFEVSTQLLLICWCLLQPISIWIQV